MEGWSVHFKCDVAIILRSRTNVDRLYSKQSLVVWHCEDFGALGQQFSLVSGGGQPLPLLRSYLSINPTTLTSSAEKTLGDFQAEASSFTKSRHKCS